MEPQGPPVQTRVERQRRIPSDELRPPIMQLRATVANNERRVFEVSDMQTIWFASTTAQLTVQFADDGCEIPVPIAAGGGTNFMRLPAGVRRIIVNNATGGPVDINWFYSAGRDFFVSFTQSPA